MDCEANQETEGIYSQPFTTPFNLDAQRARAQGQPATSQQCVARNAGPPAVHVDGERRARHGDLCGSAVGDPKLTYLGFSYGTFLGATYASLFPGKMRALALDGPVDAEQYIDRPMQGLIEQSAGLERAFGRFFQACAADQVACSGFGGSDPWSAFDELVEQANAAPIPAPGYAPDPRPIDGDDLLTAAFSKLYARQNWGELAKAYADAAKGDGSRVRQIVDEDFYGRDPETGEYDPANDLYYMLGAVEQRYRKGDVGLLPRGGRSLLGRVRPLLRQLRLRRALLRRSGRSGRVTSTADRSESRGRPRRRSWSTRPTTRRRRIAGGGASSAISATRGC